jgi:hypothetical protein
MNDLVLADMGTALAAAKPEYRTMLANTPGACSNAHGGL